jgi:lipopolysaccharide transport system permease protein
MENHSIESTLPTNRVQKTYHSSPPSTKEYFFEFYSKIHLINVLAWQEIKALYAQTYLGILWAILRPLFMTLIFTIFFKGIFNLQTKSPYYIFAFTGMISWNFFSAMAMQASSVMIQRRDLIQKLHFPKLILPIYKILVAGVEGLVGLIILIFMIIFEGIPFHWGLLTLPIFIFFNVCCALMLAVWVSSLSIKFRDLNHLLPTLIGVGIWLTPVFYPSTIIPERLNVFLYLNPMAGVIQGYRYALLGEAFPAWPFFISLGCTIILTLGGIRYLMLVEDKITDYV